MGVAQILGNKKPDLVLNLRRCDYRAPQYGDIKKNSGTHSDSSAVRKFW